MSEFLFFNLKNRPVLGVKNIKISKFYLKVGQQFSSASEIQKSQNYMMGARGGSSLFGNFSPKKFSFFSDGSPKGC